MENFKLNKKQLRIVKKLGNTYPTSVVPYNNQKPILGLDLLKDEEYISKYGKEVEGRPINPETTYMKPVISFRELNHGKRLVTYYKEYGPDEYMNRYNNWFQKHAASMFEKFPDLFEGKRKESIPQVD